MPIFSVLPSPSPVMTSIADYFHLKEGNGIFFARICSKFIPIQSKSTRIAGRFPGGENGNRRGGGGGRGGDAWKWPQPIRLHGGIAVVRSEEGPRAPMRHAPMRHATVRHATVPHAAPPHVRPARGPVKRVLPVEAPLLHASRVIAAPLLAIHAARVEDVAQGPLSLPGKGAHVVVRPPHGVPAKGGQLDERGVHLLAGVDARHPARAPPPLLSPLMSEMTGQRNLDGSLGSSV